MTVDAVPRRAVTRRDVLKFASAGTLVSALSACAGTSSATKSIGKVVVIGGGFGGATAAKHLRLWSGGNVAVTLVEPSWQFVSCPISNLVLGGSRTLADITVGYQGLRKWGVNVVHDTVASIDPEKRLVHLASGPTWAYDRLVVSPGVDFMYDRVQGMSAEATHRIPHAWKAGAQTVLLRRQLEAMPDGGVIVMSVPLAPYRCPPGPYERACQIAWYLKASKPKSKLIVLDANPQVISKGALFSRVWKEDYAVDPRLSRQRDGHRSGRRRQDLRPRDRRAREGRRAQSDSADARCRHRPQRRARDRQ